MRILGLVSILLVLSIGAAGCSSSANGMLATPGQPVAAISVPDWRRLVNDGRERCGLTLARAATATLPRSASKRRAYVGGAAVPSDQ